MLSDERLGSSIVDDSDLDSLKKNLISLAAKSIEEENLVERVKVSLTGEIGDIVEYVNGFETTYKGNLVLELPIGCTFVRKALEGDASCKTIAAQLAEKDQAPLDRQYAICARQLSWLCHDQVFADEDQLQIIRNNLRLIAGQKLDDRETSSDSLVAFHIMNLASTINQLDRVIPKMRVPGDSLPLD